jgi:tetratricopeptide (TPR) repeat protein
VRRAPDSTGQAEEARPVTADGRDALLAQFCADLRLMWRQAGGPSLRRLAEQVRLGKSQVGAILTGQIRTLPDWIVVRALVEAVAGHAREHARAGQLSMRTGVEEYWRPRYAMLEYAFSQPRQQTAAEVSGVPRQLPAPARHFTGRAAEMARLTALIDRSQTARGGGTVVIAAIDGTAGIGKTTLAVHLAHRVAGRFPDGQLYVNLRGFDPSGEPMAPGEAVRGFLDAFGVPPEQVPVGAQAQADLYRSTLAGRRVLVVLDNARDSDHIRTLLPGGPGCLAVVTSRHRMTGLVAAEGAYPLTLDLLDGDEGRNLLRQHLGTARTESEPAAVDAIVAACAGLPIALAIVAARAAAHPSFPLAALATELADARMGLDALDGGDLRTDVRAVFSWSYERLSPAAAAMFRLLGLHAGPDISVDAATRLADQPATAARRTLGELARVHLVQERTPGRFAFHDLLRAYAGELAGTVDSASDRAAAVDRVLEHYLRTAHAGSLLLSPHREPIEAPPPAPTGAFTDASDALAWFSGEHQVLLAAIRNAAVSGHDAYAWRLSWTLADFFQRRGHWPDWAATQQIALQAATRLDDPVGRAHAHRGLGRANFWLNRYDESVDHLRRALEIRTELDDRAGQARIHLDLVMALVSRRRHGAALDHAEQALALYRADHHRGGQARALNAVGWCHAQLGDLPRAAAFCQEALDLHHDLSDPLGEAATWDSLGYVRSRLGDHADAAACYEKAVALFAQSGDRYGQADTLSHLGDNQLAAGDRDGARKAWQDSLEILDQLGHPTADQVRDKLDGASRGSPDV